MPRGCGADVVEVRELEPPVEASDLVVGVKLHLLADFWPVIFSVLLDRYLKFIILI